MSLNGDLVYKTDDTLNEAWKAKLEKIMTVIKLPVFCKFIPNGYATYFVDGIDLQEDRPFQPRHDIVRALPLTAIQRHRVINILKDVVFAGIETGYTLADFTKRNIILDDMFPYLIDFDVIIEDFNQDYIDIFQRMIDYLEIPFKFNGDLKPLYECLS